MKEARYLRLGRNGIRLLDGIINLMVLFLILIMVAFGCYAIWDSQQLYQETEEEHYEQYKPIAGNDLSFEQLQKLNPDVFGWLTVYGTNIDYPLVQGEDNETYVNTSVTGESLLSGSIFLDYRNQKDFSDFNSIIYGHHMDKKVMFGEIGEFAEEAYFKEHQYGNLYFGGQDYGLEFYAFLIIDAYDSSVYSPAVEGEANRQSYLENLIAKSMCIRKNEVNTADHLVLLSTCSSDITNGRYILVGKLSETVYEDPFQNDNTWEFSSNIWGWLGRIPIWLWLMLVLTIGLIVLIIKRRKGNKSNE